MTRAFPASTWREAWLCGDHGDLAQAKAKLNLWSKIRKLKFSLGLFHGTYRYLGN